MSEGWATDESYWPKVTDQQLEVIETIYSKFSEASDVWLARYLMSEEPGTWIEEDGRHIKVCVMNIGGDNLKVMVDLVEEINAFCGNWHDQVDDEASNALNALAATLAAGLRRIDIALRHLSLPAIPDK